jgi:hypothetical protein
MNRSTLFVIYAAYVFRGWSECSVSADPRPCAK